MKVIYVDIDETICFYDGVERKYENAIPNKENIEKINTKIVFATIIELKSENISKQELERIILCDVPTKIYPDLENSFLNLIHNSGHPLIKLEKKIDFKKLYNERFN